MNTVETRPLPVQLTQEETAKKGEELALLYQQRRALEERKKDSVGLINGQLKIIEEEMASLFKAISAGEEDRDVDCSNNKDFDKGIVNFYRTDTGELLESREMTDQERQAEMELN